MTAPAVSLHMTATGYLYGRHDRWGWLCRCGVDGGGFDTRGAARADADAHLAEANAPAPCTDCAGLSCAVCTIPDCPCRLAGHDPVEGTAR